jgi:F-type H+-transporting ATPase subunit b
MEILNKFGIQPTLLFGQIVNFLIILFLLRKFFYGKIVGALEDRRKKIEESLKNADLIEERLQKTNEDSAKIIEDAQKNAQDLLTSAKQQAETTAANASMEAKKSIEAALSSAQDQIAAEKEKAKHEVQEEAMIIMSSVVKRVLGRSMSASEKEQMNKQAITEMTRQM